MTIQQQSQTSDIDLSDDFLPRLTVSDTANDVLIYNHLVKGPTINVQSLTGFNSKTKLWLHCECTYANGYPGFLTLAEAVSIGVSTGETAFTCELPLEQLSKLGDNTKITMILMISTDGTLNEHSLHVVRHHLEFRHNEASTNYSRWMTDSGPLIELLKIHELILPEAHNAGVDKEGSEFPGVRWGACQDKTFTNQLQGGMRVLDLRVYRHIDHVGTIQEFRFQHERYHARRYLQNCIQEVRQFAIQNPLEIVIMDFHEKVLPDAVNRVKDMLEAALSDRCIPWAARGLTIGQIRQQHPGRNIIIAWDDWDPSRLYLWGKVYQTWNSQNTNTPTTLKNHMIEIMADPPKNQLWSMLAAGYTPIGGPTRFTPNEIHWDYFFSSIGSGRYRTPTKGNMINIDFFASTGVVDRCISATRARALAAHQSTTLNFRAREVTDTSTTLVWSKPEDSEQVEYYKLFIDGYAFNIENNEYTFHELTPGREYHYKVVAHFASGDGNPSEIKVRNTDTTPPSKPGNLTASEILARSTTLNWTPSTDNGDIAGYKIYRNTTPIDTTSATSYVDRSLTPLTNYRYIVQAFDYGGNETNSDPLDITTPEGIAPSKPNNLKATAVTANSINLQWEASTDNVKVTGYDVLRNGDPIDRVTSTSFFDRGLDGSTTYAHQIRALDAAGNFTNSEFLFTRTLDGGAPSKPTNLKVISMGGKDYLVWNSSTDNVKVVKYEIRRDASLLGSTDHLDLDLQGFVTEDSVRPCTYIVRALDNNSNYSDSDPLRLDAFGSGT